MSDLPKFTKQATKAEIEEGGLFMPKFNDKGLIPAVTTDAATGELLMHAWMNEEALARTIASGEAWYWSRSRNELWHKGATSGQIQKVTEIRTDCDQDTVWLKVEPQGDGGCCHVGYQSCFYRSAPIGQTTGPAKLVLDGKKSKPPHSSEKLTVR